MALVLPACAEPHIAGRSPLRRPRMSPETTALDVFFARVPYGDTEANETLWQELDEQPIPIATRRRLAANGLRVGVAAGRLPVTLERMLELDALTSSGVAADASADVAVDDEDSPEVLADDALTANRTTVDPNARVTGRHVQCLDGEACLLLANDHHVDELHVLMPGEDGLRGRRFTQAQGSFDVTPTRLSDGRVRLRLLPKITHGALANRFEAQNNFSPLVAGQQSEKFEQLAVEVDLAAGEVLVVACDVDRQGSLGHRLLTTERDGERQQKLIVVRVSQTQHDPLLDALLRDAKRTEEAAE
ncbi:MAG: hypothetical protein R3C10_05095 [Pirellulales bacterium]